MRKALALARKPIPYEELVADPDAELAVDRCKIERLVDQLWEQTVLLSDLRPPMTVSEPARYVANRLAEIPAAGEHAAALADLLAEIAAMGQLDAEQAATSYPKLVARAESVHSIERSKKGPFQSDMASDWPAGGSTGRWRGGGSGGRADVRLSPTAGTSAPERVPDPVRGTLRLGP